MAYILVNKLQKNMGDPHNGKLKKPETKYMLTCVDTKLYQKAGYGPRVEESG